MNRSDPKGPGALRHPEAVEPGGGLRLKPETARDLMTPNPVSIRDTATIREAAALLTDRGISAVPVIDDAGRAVGVLSRTDIVRYDRERVDYVVPVPERMMRPDAAYPAGHRFPNGHQIESVDPTQVREIMTPAVFSVRPETPAAMVVLEMAARKVHRLFVVDAESIPVGVVSAIDIVQSLTAE